MKCIVNLVTNDSSRIEGQKRLRASLQGRFDGEFIGLIGEKSVGSPLQKDNPYAFKIYAIQHARNLGYTEILWLDASAYAVKNVQPIFDRIKFLGLFMEEAGHHVGNWCNDGTLAYFGITRDDAMQMTMYSAGFSGFDFTNPIAQEFFAEWKEAMLNGMFKGEWTNTNFSESRDSRCKGHRHDMTCGSLIAEKHGLVKKGYYNPGGTFFAYIGPGYTNPLPSAIFHVQGLK